MNPYFYLFYKMSCFINKKGNNEWGVFYAVSMLIGMNIIVVHGKLLPITQANYQGGYKTGIGFIFLVLFITNYIVFLHKDRYKKILKRYKDETLMRKKAGSFLVILYMIITFVLIFIPH